VRVPLRVADIVQLHVTWPVLPPPQQLSTADPDVSVAVMFIDPSLDWKP
jgi:hypothetical protein